MSSWPAALADRRRAETAGQSLDEQLDARLPHRSSRAGPTTTELAQLASDLASKPANATQPTPKPPSKSSASASFPPATTAADWAAWFNVAHVLLNLDETITKS